MPNTFASSAASRFRTFLINRSTTQKQMVLDGLALLSGLASERIEELAALAIEGFDFPIQAGDRRAAEKLGLSEVDALRLLGAATLIAPAIAANENPDAILEVLRAEGLVQEPSIPNLRGLLAALSSRSKEIDQRLEDKALADAVLPSFYNLETIVDLRLKFDEGQIVRKVPVAIAYLSTDASSQRLWFQLSLSGVRELKKTVDRTLKQMEEVEKLAQAVASK